MTNGQVQSAVPRRGFAGFAEAWHHSLPGQDLDVTLAYDTSGRLSGVNSGAGSFSYGYVTNSELLSGLTGPQVSTTYAYEPSRDIRTEVLNQIGTTTISRYGYRSDGIARRKDRVKEGTAFSAGVYDRFAYNDRNEVTLSRNYTGTNPDGASDPETVALARQFSYDAIGNRLTSQSGTSSVRGYTSNALNQYTALTNPSTSPVHDLDGNQTQSGTGWYYEWDAENRLTLARDYATSPINGSKKLEFTYDYRSRRIRKIESSYVSSAWTVLEDRKFIYEGWNLLGEFATSGFARICAYTWGLDLSQTHQGAGGVGGLLAVTTTTPSTATFFATYDGNGNVSEYISSTGGIEAHFEYDAFGDLTSSTGSNLGRFSHRFSSKYWDSTSGFYYYGFRYYHPSEGRWPSRDPIEEDGGLNIYAIVNSDLLNGIDRFGLSGAAVSVTPVQPGPLPGIPGTPDGPPIRLPGSGGTGGGTAIRLGGGAALFLLTPNSIGDSTIDEFNRRRLQREERIDDARRKREECGCCEMVTGLRFANIAPWSNGYSHGHQFDVEIDVENRKGEGGQAHLEWNERTNKPTSGFNGAPKNTWYDQVNQPRLPSPVFEPWFMRSIPCPGGQTINPDIS